MLLVQEVKPEDGNRGYMSIVRVGRQQSTNLLKTIQRSPFAIFRGCDR